MKAGFSQNEYFNVKHIEIHTDGMVDTQRIRSWARVQEGENLFSLDLQRVNIKEGPSSRTYGLVGLSYFTFGIS